MGTSGSWGFVFTVDGERKRWETYNHYDSYPGALGDDLLKWARSVQEQGQWDVVRERVLALRVVDDEKGPTLQELQVLIQAGLADPGVSTGKDWYAALRNCQGDPAKTLDSRLWLDATGFHLDALFCEWAYVFDLDRLVFQVYEGLEASRAGGQPMLRDPEVGGAYASVLVGEIPFHRLAQVVLGGDGTPIFAPSLDDDGPLLGDLEEAGRRAVAAYGEPVGGPTDTDGSGGV